MLRGTGDTEVAACSCSDSNFPSRYVQYGSFLFFSCRKFILPCCFFLLSANSFGFLSCRDLKIVVLWRLSLVKMFFIPWWSYTCTGNLHCYCTMCFFCVYVNYKLVFNFMWTKNPWTRCNQENLKEQDIETFSRGTLMKAIWDWSKSWLIEQSREFRNSTGSRHGHRLLPERCRGTGFVVGVSWRARPGPLGQRALKDAVRSLSGEAWGCHLPVPPV